MNAPTGKRLMLIEVDDLVDAIGALEERAADCRRWAETWQQEGCHKLAADRIKRAENFEGAVKRLSKAMEESR